MLTLHTNDKNILTWSRIQGTSLTYWSSPGCISLILLVAFSMSSWAVLNCQCVEELLWQSTGQAVQCHPDEFFPPDAALAWWAVILQEWLPQAAAAVLKGPDPPQCPVLQSHPLFSQQVQPVLISSLSPHTRGAGQRGAEGFGNGLKVGIKGTAEPTCLKAPIFIGNSACEPGWQRSCLALLPSSVQHCLCLTPWGG